MNLNYNKLIFFFALLLSTFSNAQFNEYDINKRLQVSDLHIKGNVKSVHQYTRDYYIEDEKDRTYFWQQENIYQFNREGKAIEMTTKLQEIPYSKVIHNYTKNGKVTTTEYWRYYKKDWRIDTLFIKYNKDNLVSETNTRKGYKNRFVYDDNNNLIEEKKATLKDTVFRVHKKFKYDNRNNLLKITNYGYYLNKEINDGKLSLTSMLYFKYDENNNLIEERKYRDIHKELVYKSTFSYNDKKQTVESNSYNIFTDKISLKNKHTYNKQGDRIKIEEYYYGTGKPKIETKIYKIEYDKHNNWIKQSVYKNDKLIELYKREIIYY